MNETEANQIKNVAADVETLTADGKHVLAAYKQAGIAAAIAEATAHAEDLRKSYEDVVAALPIVKAGYKSTEFWLTVGVVGLVTGPHTIGKPLPLSVDALLVAVTAIYGVIRAAIKKTPAAPAA